MPDENVVVVELTELEKIAGQPLPKTGGPEIGAVLAVILAASALLLLGLGVLAYGTARGR